MPYDSSDLAHLAGIKSEGKPPAEVEQPANESKRENDLAYLKSKMPDVPESDLLMLRLMLVIMDTKDVVGVDVFEEKPEDLGAFLAQYKLWDILKR